MIVEIVGDSKSYERALGRSEKATTGFGKAMGETSPKLGKLQGGMLVAGTSTAALAGAAVGLSVVLGGKAVNAASDLNEQISRTEVVMGDSAAAMIKWSEDTASSMGISQRAALAAAGTFAGLFQTVGVSREKAGELSRSLVQLAADLASLQNTDPAEALVALRSGLAGEAEPLRRFNIFLSEARVQQEALAETGKRATSALTQQEKTVARYNLIMKDSVLAQGNFALTAGDMANKQRTAAAELDNLSSSAGQVLIPAMESAYGVMGLFAGSLNDAIGGMSDLHAWFRKTEIFDPWNKGIEDANKGALDFFKHIRDGIPFMEKFLELREQMTGQGGEPLPSTPGGRRGHGAGGRPAQTPTEAAAALRRAGQAAIDQITRQASAQDDYNRLLAASVTRAEHLRDLIREDPSNARLQQRLSAELRKQSTLRKTIASDAASAAASARSEAESAAQTRRENEQERRAREKERAESRRQATKARQFKALGLTGEGLKPTPGSGSLLNRALGLQGQVKGTVLDTPKVNAQLKKIVAFLKKNFGKAGKDVRAAILQMLNEISGAFDPKKGGGATTGPLTKTHGLNTRKLTEGLGLSAEEERALRQRLSKFNSAGRALSGGNTNLPSGTGTAVAERPIVIENRLTLDGRVVATSTTRHQQQDRRRNPKQKRGQHRS